MTDENDVDLLVQFHRPVGAFEFLDLQGDLARVLGRRVDLRPRRLEVPGRPQDPGRGAVEPDRARCGRVRRP